MGEWIEINSTLGNLLHIIVSPYMGEWIEIYHQKTYTYLVWSLPIWESGLKYYFPCKSVNESRVSPYMGEWIEIC